MNLPFSTIISDSLAKAKTWLDQDELVAIPTETVYGLAGNALKSDVLSKIFHVKARPDNHPLILHIANIDQINKYVTEASSIESLLMESFWPGPLTLLIDKSEAVPNELTGGRKKVGIRIPDHELTLRLLQSLDYPLAAPSANPFGYISPTSAQHVFDQMSGKIPHILDGGDCSRGIESTIVEVQGDWCLIHRLGALSLEDIQLVCPNIKDLSAETEIHETSGQMPWHYAPQKRLYLDRHEMLSSASPSLKIGYISFRGEITNEHIYQSCLSPSGNLEEAGRNLFLALRKIDNSEVDFIVAESVPNIGIGRAINERLRKAAAKTKKAQIS